jgi:hypothetical protein
MFLSNNPHSYVNLDAVRVPGNEVAEGRNKEPPADMIQYVPEDPDRNEIMRIVNIIHNAPSCTQLSQLPTTSEIARAYGYDPEKFCQLFLPPILILACDVYTAIALNIPGFE